MVGAVGHPRLRHSVGRLVGEKHPLLENAAAWLRCFIINWRKVASKFNILEKVLSV
jgi:hypothetical protein